MRLWHEEPMSLVHLVVKARHGKNLHQSDVEAELLSLGEPRVVHVTGNPRVTRPLPVPVPA
jgi:hypothetical protein